jgi:hypothetical protein
MTAMGHLKKLSGALALIAMSAGCGDVVRQGRSPVFLVIDSLQASRGGTQAGPLQGTLLSDVLTLVTSPAPCSTAAPCATVFNDMGLVNLRFSPKDAASPTDPTSNNEVTITRYHVTYRRTDGRNTPGADVPYGFDGGATGTVPAGGVLQLQFEIVRHTSKGESPLVQLATSQTIISTIADVTFYGRDQVGNDISVTGSISIDFGNFGD